MKNYEIYLNKLVSDGIEAKCSLADILLAIKELSGKLDTLIALRIRNGKADPEAQIQDPPCPKKLIAEVVAQQVQNSLRPRRR